MPDGLHLLEIEDGVWRLRAGSVVPADAGGVEMNDALHVLRGRFLDTGNGFLDDAGGVDGVHVHVCSQPRHELALEAGDQIDYAAGNVARLKDFAEGDGGERARLGGDGDHRVAADDCWCDAAHQSEECWL